MAMPERVLSFGKRWFVTTVGVLVAAKVVGGIHYDDWESLLVASLLLGFLNAFVRPILLILSLPLLLFSAGLFLLVINALLLWTVGGLVHGFQVTGFWSAVWGALIIGAVSIAFGFLTGGRASLRVQRPSKPSDPESGPIIDV